MQRPQSPTSSSSTITSRSSTSRSNRLSNWKKIVQENDEAVAAHEVDQYLDAPLDPTDEEDQFDILCWWKVNGCKYPVLAAIARDVLAIQTSTVASESCFSTGGRVIDPFRSSLTPKSVEGLICMQNWMLGDDIAEVVEDIDEPTIENMEFYYDVERGIIIEVFIVYTFWLFLYAHQTNSFSLAEHESTASSKNNCPPPAPKAKGKGKSVAIGVINV